MASSLLAGLSGALQGVLQGIQQNQQTADAKAAKKQELEIRALQLLAEHGDDEIKPLAVAGLMEAADSPKFKGGILGKVFGKGDTESNPYLQRINQVLAEHGGGGPAGAPGGPPGPPAEQAGGAAAPAPTAVAAAGQAPGSVMAGGVPGGPLTPPAPAGPSSAAAVAPGGPAESAWAPGDIGKDAGDLMPIKPGAAAMAPTAGTPTNGQPSGVKPIAMAAGARPPAAQASMSAVEAMGPPPSGVAPSREDVAKQVAPTYGATPEQLSDPKYAYPGHLRDPVRQAAQTQFRGQVEQTQQAGQVDATRRLDQYRDSIVALTGQVTTATVREQGETARAKIHEEGETSRATAATTAAERADKKQAKAAWSKEMGDLDKMEAKKDPLGKPLYTPEQLADLREHADSRYQELTGEAPAHAAGRVAVRDAGDASVARAGAGAAARSKGGPPAGPGMLPPGGGVLAAAPGGGPPGAPPASADQQRVDALKTKARTRGRESLTAEERSFLLNYYQGLTGKGPGGPPAGSLVQAAQ